MRAASGRNGSSTPPSRPGHGHWQDGRRTVLEIVDLIEMETSVRDAELVVYYFELLKKLDLVSF